MIKQLQITCKFTLTGLCFILNTLFAQSVYAQTYTLNVGEKYTLPYPTPPAGYVDHLGAGRCTNISDCIGVSGLQVYVYNYFSGTATVAIDYNYTYTGTYDNRTHVGTSTAYYSIKCQPTTVTLNKTELTMDVGDEIELKYNTDPYGMEPYVNWRTSDKNIVKLDYSSKESIEWEKTMPIYAAAEGTCTITLQCNTGKPSPQCKITVVDSKWVKADIPSGSVKRGTLLTLTSSKAGATIYYTTDGKEPNKQSTRYTQPIPINESMTLKAKAYLGSEESKTTTREYTVVNYEDGDVFTYTTIEGVDVQMKAYLRSSSLELQVGTGIEGQTAIDKNFTGHITIPSYIEGIGVHRIGEYAFDGCKLSSISIAFSSVVYSGICSYAFRGCTNLMEITIPHAAALLPYSFMNCSSLRTVIFDGSVDFITSITGSTTYNTASNVFSGSNAIKRIYIYTTYAEDIKDDLFPQNVLSDAILYVPESALSKYKQKNGWKDFSNIETIEMAKEKQVQLTTSLLGNFAVSSGENVILSSPNITTADIYYTLDGSTPSKSSTKYNSNGIAINKKSVLKAIAYKSGYEDSNILIAGTFDKRKVYTSPMKGSVKQVAAGRTYTLFVKTDGSLWACGNNTSGQFGDGTTKSSTTPKKIMDDVESVSAHGDFSLIVKNDGSLWTCGSNYYGQLGNGTTTNQSTPVKIMDGVASVSTGESHSLIVKKDRTLWTCGYNSHGQLGDGTTTNRATPKKVMNDVAYADAGANHSLIVKTDGSLWVCGYNGSYQLGDGTYTDRATPKKIMDDVASVAGGQWHSLIVKTDGSLWACGNNDDGELGDGTTTVRKTFVKIMDGVASVSASMRYSLIIKTDKTLWSCGRNTYGQLGDGTTMGRTTPVRISDGVVSTSAGVYHVLFAKKDGSLWACGSNALGRLGDGINWDSAMPRLVGDSPEERKIELSPAGYATFFDSQSAFSLPSGLTAQVVSGVGNGKITYQNLTGSVVPKNVPVMLKSNTQQAGTYTLTASESNATYSGTNLLHGSDEATTTTGNGSHYKLSYGQSGTAWDGVFGWYWGAQNGAAFPIDGHKAWLVVPNSGSTRAAGFTIDGDATEMISIEENDATHNIYYDMQGRRINAPTKSGLYIKNGKKVVIK